MSLGRENEPTLAVPKSVGWVLTWGWIARSFVAMFEALLSSELEAKGALQQENLSESIEGLQDGCFGVIEKNLSQKGPFSFSACLELLWKLRDPQERSEMAHQLEKRISTRICPKWKHS
jgi:hypothetical protein